MWINADSGTKAVDLSAGLIATGTFGIMLLALERALAVRLEETAVTTSALAPTGGESKDEANQRPAIPVDEAAPHEPAAPLRPFKAIFAGWMRDRSRIDASQIRVRVFEGDDYFQFFTGVVSGPALRTTVHGSTTLTLEQYKRGCALAMIRAIQDSIAIGGVPLPDPTDAVEVLVDNKLAAKFAAGAPTKSLEEDEEIGTWLG